MIVYYTFQCYIETVLIYCPDLYINSCSFHYYGNGLQTNATDLFVCNCQYCNALQLQGGG